MPWHRARWTCVSVLFTLCFAQGACNGHLSQRRGGDAGPHRTDTGPVSPFPAPPDTEDGAPRRDASGPIVDAGGTPIAPRDAGRDAPSAVSDASGPPSGPCAYPPGATGRMAMGGVISPYRWTSAYREDGTRSEFDLARFHCDAEWDAYTAVLFVVGTGWCPNCPAYLRSIAALDLGARGTLVVFLESQNSSYETATSVEARSTVDRVVGRASGLRIGEADNTDVDAIGRQTGAVPAGYFVRRSDMQILADENALGATPPWDEMAASPDLDWVARLRGGGAATCTEEALEPNDTRAGAVAIDVGAFSGGICGPDDDFFRVSLSGAWQVDLRFRHSDGDLDLFVLDDLGRVVVTSDSADDDESVSYVGPATLRILGYAGATAPYGLTLATR